MLTLLFSLRDCFRARAVLQAEILVLRHQLLVLQRSSCGHKLRLRWVDRVLWVWLSRLWNDWRSALLLVKPETVIAWHRKGFRHYWIWKSRHLEGRPSVSNEVRNLIQKMSLANPCWGAPRIPGELLKLGIQVSLATVAKYMVRKRKPPSQSWRTFLKNHARDLVSVDFFVVPTIRFQLLFAFVILRHDRRRPIHFAVTSNPTAEWTARQLWKPSPGTTPRVTCCATGTACTARSSVRPRNGWAFGKSWLRRDHPGKRTMLHTAPPGYAVILLRSRGLVVTALCLGLFGADRHLDVHTDSGFYRCKCDRESAHGDSIS